MNFWLLRLKSKKPFTKPLLLKFNERILTILLLVDLEIAIRMKIKQEASSMKTEAKI